jgi:hypothetical protein
MGSKSLYETDFAEWSSRTAELIRSGRFEEIEAENVAEEIESLGRSERHQLSSRITQILEHLLKLKITSGPLRDANERGWRGSIVRQQGEIEELISESPSLKRRLTSETLEKCYRTAAGTVATEYAVRPPARCPFSWSDVLRTKKKVAK